MTLPPSDMQPASPNSSATDSPPAPDDPLSNQQHQQTILLFMIKAAQREGDEQAVKRYLQVARQKGINLKLD